MSDSRSTRVVLVSALVAVLVAGLLTAIGILGFPSTANANEQLFLEASQDVGENPFAPATGTKNPVSRPGGDPGSGVNLESAECDPAALVASLTGDASLAAAWTAALNSDPSLTWSGGSSVRPDQVEAYIAELTSQVLAKDIRVTNFQYKSGAPTSVQSVLQTGSSVMVDQAGVVRVRCKCGNPLIPMKRLTAKPVYQGTPWDGFVDIDIIIITKCDDDEYYDEDDDRCRPIDCDEGYYYDGRACRPIDCDDDERYQDGHCRPIYCDDDEFADDGRCFPKECDEDEYWDGKECWPIECDGGQIRVGKDCQDPCDPGYSFDGNECTKDDCPDGEVETDLGCMPECEDGVQQVSTCVAPAPAQPPTCTDANADTPECRMMTAQAQRSALQQACATTPDAPECIAGSGTPPDCAVTPLPVGCVPPDCAVTPLPAGCVPPDCAVTPLPAGCEQAPPVTPTVDCTAIPINPACAIDCVTYPYPQDPRCEPPVTTPPNGETTTPPNGEEQGQTEGEQNGDSTEEETEGDDEVSGDNG
ncbi:MAG: DUF6777 domain-containing protein [Pseudonocardia sp.]